MRGRTHRHRRTGGQNARACTLTPAWVALEVTRLAGGRVRPEPRSYVRARFGAISQSRDLARRWSVAGDRSGLGWTGSSIKETPHSSEDLILFISVRPGVASTLTCPTPFVLNKPPPDSESRTAGSGPPSVTARSAYRAVPADARASASSSSTRSPRPSLHAFAARPPAHAGRGCGAPYSALQRSLNAATCWEVTSGRTWSMMGA